MANKVRSWMPWLLAAAFSFAALSLLTSPGARMEHGLLDWNLAQLAVRAPPDPDIVILDIDEPTLEAMAPDYGRFPWSRAVYGALIEALARQKPAAIVFDILLVDPQKEHEQDDLYLIRTAQRTPNVFFPMVRLPGGEKADRDGFPLRRLPGIERTPAADDDARAALLLPLAGLTATGRIGVIDIDNDAVIRRYPLYREIKGWRIPSLPARVAGALGYTVPPGEMLPMVWHGPARSYRTVPFHEVYFDAERRRPLRPANEFTGKIVVIGGSAAGLFDLKPTPVSAYFPGPEIVATALDNLKNDERLGFAPAASAPLIAAAMLLALAFVFARGVSPVNAGIGLLGASVLLIGGAAWAVIRHRFAFPVVGPLAFAWIYYLVLALRAWLLERRNRQRVTQLFARFLDPRVVAELVAHGDVAAAAAGQKREITVLFSDIRGFTTLSERKPPQEVVDLLNRYFRLQVEIIFRHQGTLDKYIGDAIMAFWGAPAEQPDHARRALLAARDMEQALLGFRKELEQTGVDFDIGIGLNTGEAIVGFIGSPEHRQDYTVIGDAVNTASRIEGVTKGRARILVSRTTRAAVSEFQFRDHGQVALKGKEEAVQLFEPIW